jgi:hypothetical protein
LEIGREVQVEITPVVDQECLYFIELVIIKQLLDEAEHDIKNYSDRGQCYLPKRS